MRSIVAMVGQLDPAHRSQLVDLLRQAPSQ